MPRLFTAIEVPAAIGQALAMLRGGLPGARWIDPDAYHLTLCFIGDIDDRLARDVAAVLGRSARPDFDVEIDGVDAFGGTRPRSVFARVAASAPLVGLQSTQERVLRRLGVPLEARHYTPHITLARLRAGATSRLTADWLALRGGGRFAFHAHRFALMSSRDSVGGGPYMVEQVYALGEGGLAATEQGDVSWPND